MDAGKSKANQSSAISKARAKTEDLTVDIEEYNRLKDDLEKLNTDYGKLVWARNHLETKVREQKDSIRQWKEYRKDWILRHPNKRLAHLRPSSANVSPLIDAEISRSSSAPAPPALPEGLTPSPSVVSESPSLRRDVSIAPKDIECQHNEVVEHHSGDEGSQSHEISLSQAGRSIANASESGDVTEASHESERDSEPIKTEPNAGGSSPVVVFERSLKRRHSARASVQHIQVYEDNPRHLGAAPRTVPPKNELSSSPMQAPPLIHLDDPHDSLDLDDVGGHLDTPRKRQRMEQERLMSLKKVHFSALQGEEDMPDDMTAGENIRYLDELRPEIEGEQDYETYLPGIHGTLPGNVTEKEKKARRDEKLARQHAHNDRVYQRLEASKVRDDPLFDPPRSSSPTTNESAPQPHTPNDPRELGQWKPHLASPVILQPRDVNTSVLPRTDDPHTSRKRPCPPSRRDRGAAYVPVLAEDGEGYPLKSSTHKVRKKSKDDQDILRGPSDEEPKAPPTHHRLGALLTKPSPEKSLLIPEKPVTAVSADQAWSKTPIPRSVYTNRSRDLATPRSLPAKRSEYKHSVGNKSRSTDFKPIDATIDRYSKSAQAVNKRITAVPGLRKNLPVDPTDTRPEHEPLRARPLHRLGLQDFKFNPAHNSYAIQAPVRKHDEKKSLSGCTDRHCQRCKGLRQYVIVSGYKTAPKPGESEDDADWRLMQDYLGDNRRQLRGMSAKEREDLLLEAKVKEFANRFGCHRQAFSRAWEPPGLWDVDFPTTQEEAEVRAAADLMEREKVQERYWEATRPGGKWMFADE